MSLRQPKRRVSSCISHQFQDKLIFEFFLKSSSGNAKMVSQERGNKLTSSFYDLLFVFNVQADNFIIIEHIKLLESKNRGDI